MVSGVAGFSGTTLALILLVVARIPFGVFLTCWPRTLQRLVQRGFARDWDNQKLEDLLNSEYYAFSIRFVGVLALGVGAIALTLLIRELGT